MEMLALIDEKLEKMDPDSFEKKAAELLWGLGFGKQMMQKMTKDMSGGWRMRVSDSTDLINDYGKPVQHLNLLKHTIQIMSCVWSITVLLTLWSALNPKQNMRNFKNFLHNYNNIPPGFPRASALRRAYAAPSR
jgi:hypothetical protein